MQKNGRICQNRVIWTERSGHLEKRSHKAVENKSNSQNGTRFWTARTERSRPQVFARLDAGISAAGSSAFDAIRFQERDKSLWVAPAPCFRFEERSLFRGAVLRGPGLKAQPIVAP